MKNYIGEKCPYCGKTFTENDDIVVCPDCGTPHHRSCYREHGSCANTGSHNSEFRWNPQMKKETAESIVCPECGCKNTAGSRFCANCGCPLQDNKTEKTEQRPDFSRNGFGFRTVQLPLNSAVDGIPVKDWLVYLGQASMGYVFSFMKQDKTGRKIGFSLPCLVSPFLYFVYYGSAKFALLSLLLAFICRLPTFLYYFVESAPSLIGISVNTLITLADIGSYLFLAYSVIIAVKSKWIIRKEAAKKIRSIRRECTNEEEYSETLQKKSCPSLASKVILIGMILVCLISVLSL